MDFPRVTGIFRAFDLNASLCNRFPSLRSMSDVTSPRTTVTLAIHDILAEPTVTSSADTGAIPSGEDIEKFMEPYMDRCDQWSGTRKRPRSSERSEPIPNGEPVAKKSWMEATVQDPTEVLTAATTRTNFHGSNTTPSSAPSPSLRADLAESVRLLGIYGVDPKRTLRSLLTRARVEFPESQWLRLLTNKAVDLDAVFSGIYSITPSNAHTESVGGH
ncbi:hypothetical protein K438DRAFT_1246720 [Mycena galopus ATCC 62051]|nr:hypothetical protein K438DRAFT_1246720 [Mycena galopus ATCC 62051]